MARMLIVGALLLLQGCVSIKAERAQIDQAMWAILAEEYGPVVEDASVQSYLTKLGERLAEHAPAHEDGPTDWVFVVLDDDSIQAFGTIDGTVAITRALAAEFETEDELAGELARQIAHARLQHLWGFMNNQISSAGFFIWPKGAAIGLEDAKVEYASWLFHRDGVGFMHPFQAWQLLEADDAAMTMMAQAGFDPAGVRRSIQIAAELPGSPYAQTYGHLAARDKAIQAWLATHEAPDRRPGEGFEAFHEAVSSAPSP